jgi:hypothetical protein
VHVMVSSRPADSLVSAAAASSVSSARPWQSAQRGASL